jgi:hypothetical protein
MTKNNKTAGINRRKIIPVIIIIIGLIIFSSFYFGYNFRVETPEDIVDKSDKKDKIEFTLIIENTHDIKNFQLSWQLENSDDNTFSFSYPILETNLHLYIKAINGTVYQFSSILGSTVWPLYISMSPGEIKEGVAPEKLFTIYTRDFGENINYSITYWQNRTTGEYWFFESGTYEIYGEYESYEPYKDSIKDAIIGIWQSNVITFTI